MHTTTYNHSHTLLSMILDYNSTSTRLVSECYLTSHTQLYSGLVNQLAQLLRTVYNVRLVSVLLFNELLDLGIFPRSSQVEFASAVELVLSFDGRIENPLSIGKVIQ